MAEAEEEATSQDRDDVLDAMAGIGQAMATPAKGEPAVDAAPSSVDVAESVDAAAPAAERPQTRTQAVPQKTGPGFAIRAIRWLRWGHSLVFLGLSLGLAAYAWLIFPESDARTVPPAEAFYNDGLDRLYRVLNPDLPLLADTPADEALAARNAFLNLFVFHRDTLREYPDFINPHLLLAEANRILAEFNPAMADKYYADAAIAYVDAALWENREDDPGRLVVYYDSNFLGGRGRGGPLSAADPDNEELALRRARRLDYIGFRRAEADVNTGHPELALPVFEDLRRREDARRREALRLSTQDDMAAGDASRRAFELGPDEYRKLDLLLARATDGLGRLDDAKGWYLRYLASVPAGRDHAFVVERLAYIAMGDGEVYRRANPEAAAGHYRAAADYYRSLIDSPSVTRRQHDAAMMGLARANSRLAELVPPGDMTGVDEIGRVGRTLRGWLEEFSGQPLPRRVLALPQALGDTLAKPELVLPGTLALPGVVGGSLAAMAGGGMVTPQEQKRRYLAEALAGYDRVAALAAGTREGELAAVDAAWESWSLGQKADTESRFERMIDPLSSPELVLAARLGLATVALDRGELKRAHILILGGFAHPQSLWFTPSDADWRKLIFRLGTPSSRAEAGVWRRVWDSMPAEGREIAGYAASGRRLDDDYVNRFLRSLNTMLRRRDFYSPEDFPPRNRNFYLDYVLERDPRLLTEEEVVWRNRLLLEEAWPYDLAQKAGRDNVGFEPFPPLPELPADGLVDSGRVRDLLLELARAWARRGREGETRPETTRMIMESNAAYLAAMNRYNGDPGDILYELANNYETLAEIRELEGDHLEALSLTAEAARSYLDVSWKARGSPREMDALLAAGDAFFRSGLLGRAVESQMRFLERFGYSSIPGTDSAMAVVRAENLLGRSYWFLKDIDNALASFRRNIPRRTPDRFKSMYYIGRVLLDEGVVGDKPELLGTDDDPLPALDRNGDPVIETALQSFNYVRQSPGINPTARAWRWSTFDLGHLRYVFAERARKEWEAAQTRAGGTANGHKPWLGLYDQARVVLTEALERYPLRRNGGIGLSVRVEPEDYADVMASRFETEYLLAKTLITLADAREDEALHSLARAHLENMRDRNIYARALFDRTLDRFQLNAAVIREEVEGGNWDRSTPLPRTRLGDDEGPTHSPQILHNTLRNSMLLLGNEYFRAGERARERQLLASTDAGGTVAPSDAAAGYYQSAYRVWQDVYDRFGLPDGPMAMVNMGDALNRLGYPGDAGNHYRNGRNMAEMQDPGTKSDGTLNIGPAYWGTIAEKRLQDMRDGYVVP